ncbi:MAG: signal peptidase I [Armatimonadota bacterium]
MGITERLANLSIPAVLTIIAVLMVIRYALKQVDQPWAKSVGETAESLAFALALVFLIIKPFIVQAFFIPSASMRPTLLERDHIMVNKFIYRFKEPQRGDIVVFRAPMNATGGIKQDFIKRLVAVPGDEVRITPGYILVDGVPKDRAELKSMLVPLGEEGKLLLTDNKVYIDRKEISIKEIADKFDTDPENIKIVPGKLYINGVAQDEPYIAEDPSMPYPNERTDKKWIVKDKNGNDVVKIPEGKLLVIGDNRNESNDARFWGLLDRKRILGKAMFKFWPPSRIGLIK